MNDTFTDYARYALRHLFAAHRLDFWLQCLVCMLIVMSLAGCGEKTPKSSPPPRPVRFVIAPHPSSAGPFIQTGEIRAHDEVMLGFRLDGRLLSRTVDVGDRVAAGQLLGTLESDTSQNQIDSARADLSSALAAEQAASLNLKRMTLLMPQGAIARAQLDTARSDWQAAVSQRQSNEAALRNARDSLSWTRLTAPESGIVTQVNASPGQVVGAGQTVMTLAVSHGRDAVFDVADPQVITRNTGAPFFISLLADPSIRASGTLRDISPQADPQTRTWRVRITLIDPPPSMALGAIIQGELPQAGPAMIALPASALTRAGGNPAVFVVDRASLRLRLRPVSLGRFTATDIFVAGGIRPGDTVVTAGVSKLRQGEKVSLGGDGE